MKAAVDENVPIVANDSAKLGQRLNLLSPQADEACRQAAIKALVKLRAQGIILVDDEGAVLGRYRDKLSGKGQPGVGDAFLKDLSDNQFNPRRVQRVALQRDGDNYTAFPEDVELKKFDRSDRIFVALVVGVPDAEIINAVDSDYQLFHAALNRNGVTVRELCRSCLRRLPKSRGKKGKGRPRQ